MPGQGFGPPLAAPADLGGEPAGEGLALGRLRRGQVRRQVGRAQTLPGPRGERGDPARRQAEQLRHLLRRQALDHRVPQHRLPPLRERAERRDDQLVLGGGGEDLVGGEGVLGLVGPVLDVVGGEGAPVAGRPGRRGVADDRQEVGAPAVGRPAARPHGRQGPDEGLAREVLGAVVHAA